jgi:hypothetical protein
VRGVDYLLFRADGVGVIDVYETITAGDSRVISARVRGYIVPAAGVEMPPPHVLIDPDFRWPTPNSRCMASRCIAPVLRGGRS